MIPLNSQPHQDAFCPKLCFLVSPWEPNRWWQTVGVVFNSGKLWMSKYRDPHQWTRNHTEPHGTTRTYTNRTNLRRPTGAHAEPQGPCGATWTHTFPNISSRNDPPELLWVAAALQTLPINLKFKRLREAHVSFLVSVSQGTIIWEVQFE